MFGDDARSFGGRAFAVTPMSCRSLTAERIIIR